MSSEVLVQQARALVQQIATGLQSDYGLSSIAPSIYDTAWLAMVPDKSQKRNKWLFPESFTYLLNHQDPDGGWDPLEQSNRAAKYSDSLWLPDCIIHSLAALLAICRHLRLGTCEGGNSVLDDMPSRIIRAKDFLDSKLRIWTLDGITHFGYELLVPVLLQLLEEEGHVFDFPVKAELLMRYERASNIDLSWLYNGPCQVPLFSLEAFVGKLDFSRLDHLVTTAGIAASPASTAAYLIYCPTWNDQCNAYLQHVVKYSLPKRNGAVGGIFPLELFELSWVMTTLLENGFTVDNLGAKPVHYILEVTQGQLHNGVTGATHVWSPDADDTSRAITALNMQGYHICPKEMVRTFEVDRCFETFDIKMPKRVTSVSVNGNVLTSLLHSLDPSLFLSQIDKVSRFICNQWSSDGRIEDHWNISEYYGLMQMAQSLTLLLSVHDQGLLPSLSLDITLELVPFVLEQILVYILKKQNIDGSWGELHCSEETAYAVVALVNLGCDLAAVSDSYHRLHLAIARGKNFLLENRIPMNEKPDRLWTGKVLHGISYVGEAYILAALKAA